MERSDLSVALDAARAGDERAVTCLFRELQPQLLRYLRHRAPGVAEDLASETWLAAARGLGGFSGDGGAFRAWLFAIARRRVADHYRRQARSPRMAELDAGSDPAASADTAEVALAAFTAQGAVAALAHNLPADQAEVVLLRVLGDLSVDEVAQIMGRSPGWVRVAQHRALRRLAQVWDRRCVTP